MKFNAKFKNKQTVWLRRCVPLLAVLLWGGCGKTASDSPAAPSAESLTKSSSGNATDGNADDVKTPTSDSDKAVSVDDTVSVEDTGISKEAAPAPAVLEAPLDMAEQIQVIKQAYAHINSNIRTFKTDTKSFHDGGEVPVTLYREGENLRKVTIDALASFDMLSYYVEGYFQNNRLIFVMYKESTAVNPNMATGEVEAWQNAQHRVYVNNGKVIRHLKKEERQSPDAESQIQKVANVPVRDPKEIAHMSREINEWFGSASMVRLFGNRGYPCCLTLIGKPE